MARVSCVSRCTKGLCRLLLPAQGVKHLLATSGRWAEVSVTKFLKWSTGTAKLNRRNVLLEFTAALVILFWVMHRMQIRPTHVQEVYVVTKVTSGGEAWSCARCSAPPAEHAFPSPALIQGRSAGSEFLSFSHQEPC